MVHAYEKKKLSELLKQTKRKMCASLKQTNFSYKTIANMLNISESSVKRWVKRSKQTENVNDAKRSGRPKKVTKSLEGKVKKYLCTPRYGSLRATQKKLSVQNVSLSVETVRNLSKKVGAKFTIRPLKPFLKEVHKQKRLLFVNKYLNENYVNIEKKMVFYDESYIWTFNRPKGSWILKDSKDSKIISNPKVAFTSKLMVAAFISMKGKSSIFIFR